MTNVAIDHWNKMYKLITQHKFVIIGDVNEDYKCGICKNILINAHQAICGCNFCYDCINQYMANGDINCPNNNEECELESLSNIAPNHVKNKQISKLIVRCSNKMCSHKCKLIEMENHLNSCLNKAVKCPFIDVGCEHDDMINDKLNDHMLSDIHNHNKILIDLIGNLRNEMRELKEKVEGNRLEIEMLKENDRIKSEIIELLKEEIKSIKQENEDLTEQMEIGDRNLWYKFDEIDIEMKNKCKKEELLKEFDEKFNMEMNARYCDMKEEWNEKLDEKIDKKMREENDKLDIERSNKIDKYLNMRDCGELQIGAQNTNSNTFSSAPPMNFSHQQPTFNQNFPQFSLPSNNNQTQSNMFRSPHNNNPFQIGSSCSVPTGNSSTTFPNSATKQTGLNLNSIQQGLFQLNSGSNNRPNLSAPATANSRRRLK